jgi:hypothetical protein
MNAKCDRTTEKQVILNDDPRAAELVTAQLWKSLDGRLYNEERSARYASSTHTRCECGAVAPKHYTHCDDCREKRRHARYLELPLVEYTNQVLCLDDGDEYFFFIEEVYDHADANELKVSEMDLVVAEPQAPRELDYDHWCDDLPEDTDLPKEICDALDAFNEVFRKHFPQSYYPVKQRVSLPDEAQ